MLLNYTKKNIIDFYQKGNFLKSRLSQILIFICNFNLLRKLLLKEKPDFLIAHLIVSLPLALFFF